MLLSRINSELHITGYSPEEQSKLEELCTIVYRIPHLNNKIERDVLKPYTIRDGTFITSMGFLHGVINAFPGRTQINITPLPTIGLTAKTNIKLWQEQMDILRTFWKMGRAVVTLPTGTGKTILASYAMIWLNKPTLICIPTDIIQKDTWYKMLIREFHIPPYMIGFFGGRINNRTSRDIKPITIATYKSAYMKIDQLKGKFDFIIYDEVHHVASNKQKIIPLRIGSLYSLGLSATVDRKDKNEELIYGLIGKKVLGPTTEYFEAREKVAPVDHRVYKVSLTPDERRKYQRFRYAARMSDNQSDRSKYNYEALSIATSAVNKMPVLLDLVMRHNQQRIIVFSIYVEHLVRMYELMAPYFRVAVLTYETDDVETKEILAKFHTGEINVLLTCMRADEGLNVPAADVGIVYAGYGVQRQKIQRRGRINRFSPGKVARLYEIVARETVDEQLWKKRNNLIMQPTSLPLQS